jgi:flagellar hook assembly protein FlgD
MISIKIYNEAGELIGIIGDGIFSEERVDAFDFANEVDILTDENGEIVVVFPNGSRYSWHGIDLNGNQVGNGTYLVQVESVDHVGIVTTITQSVAVVRSEARVSVKVYNEAGELIWESEIRDGVVPEMELISLSSGRLNPLSETIGQSELVITLGGAGEVTWDGRDSSGNVVANGEYLVEVRVAVDGDETLITRTVTVLHGELALIGEVVVSPNPVLGGESVMISVGGPEVAEIRVGIYNISGELVRKLSSAGKSVSWDLQAGGQQAAAGVYVGVVSAIDSGGAVDQKLVRIVVLR